MGFGMGIGMFNIMFVLVFGIVIVMFIVTAVRGISTWHKNNNSPRLTVEATVAAKRQNVDVHHHNTGDNGAMHTTTSTTYYVTFQVASGDRMELHVSGREYGQLAEGDFGELTFQGTRYLGFERRSSGAAMTSLMTAATASGLLGTRNDKRKRQRAASCGKQPFYHIEKGQKMLLSGEQCPVAGKLVAADLGELRQQVGHG